MLNISIVTALSEILYSMMLKMYKYLKFGKTIINIFAVENGH
jgi:hypothetical protein